MALHPSRQEELRQLMVFRDLIAADPQVRFTIKLTKDALDYSRLLVTFNGLATLTVNGSGFQKHAGPVSARFTIPPGHAATTRVSIGFTGPVPFHPHVYTNGSICWGNVASSESGSWTLVLWTIALLEILQLNQQSFIGINPQSPANPDANRWRNSHQNQIGREVPPIDLARVRQLSYQVR